MDTEVIQDKQLALGSTPARSAEELSRRGDVAVLFDAIVYFSEMVAGDQGKQPSSHHRAVGALPGPKPAGPKPAGPMRGRSLVRPWRFLAAHPSSEK